MRCLVAVNGAALLRSRRLLAASTKRLALATRDRRERTAAHQVVRALRTAPRRFRCTVGTEHAPLLERREIRAADVAEALAILGQRSPMLDVLEGEGGPIVVRIEALS